MTEDGLTGAKVATFYVRIPCTAAPEDGAQIRLMSSEAGGLRSMLFVTLTRDQSVVIGRSSVGGGGGREDAILARVTAEDQLPWLSADKYVGFWILVATGGRLSIGLLDEATLAQPLVSWQDPAAMEASAEAEGNEASASRMNNVGLTAIGSAVFFKYTCSLGAPFPGGLCLSTGVDCAHLAHTECRPWLAGSDGVNAMEQGDGDTLVIAQTCQCQPGHLPIPSENQH